MDELIYENNKEWINKYMVKRKSKERKKLNERFVALTTYGRYSEPNVLFSGQFND